MRRLEATRPRRAADAGASALFLGRVMHRRLDRVAHRFTYRVFSLLVDLDELPLLAHSRRLFSHNRWNVLSLWDRDHGPKDGTALRPWIDAQLRRAGLDPVGGSVQLLCFPRLFGYVFNPLSLWFCRDRSGRLQAVLYEVRNTFGEWHGYLIPVDAGHARGRPVRQRCEKRFYVSPFIDMKARYDFRVNEPGETFDLVIRESAGGAPVLAATHVATRAALTDANLLSAVISHPLMTARVMVGIHWQALRLWRKGAAFHRRPPPPRETVTLVGRLSDARGTSFPA